MAKEKSLLTKLKPEELEKIVADLANKGETPAKIGLILRDKHSIPKLKLLGKKITQTLKQANAPIMTEKQIVEKNINVLKEHIKKNKKDHAAKRSLTKKLWAIQKLE